MRALLDEITTRQQLASVSVCVRVDGEERFHHTSGMARLMPVQPAALDQAYDLASVTKALAGSAVFASLVEDGLDLRTPVSKILGTPNHPDATRPIEIRDLLQHGSGLAAWHPFYRDLTAPFGTQAARDQLFDAVRSSPPVTPPGVQHTYSDIGFLQLLCIAETLTGQGFAELFEARVRRPSGVRDLRYHWPQAAATEWPCPHRGIGIQGTVHDLNCASIGGVSTHAGLFGTARAVAELGEWFLDRAVLQRFWTDQGPGSHVIGWDTISRDGPTSTGRFFPDGCVGHLGYTGTSIWISPRHRTVVVLLSNRVHPIDDLTSIKALRPKIHDAIATEVLAWS